MIELLKMGIVLANNRWVCLGKQSPVCTLVSVGPPSWLCLFQDGSSRSGAGSGGTVSGGGRDHLWSASLLSLAPRVTAEDLILVVAASFLLLAPGSLLLPFLADSVS